MSALEAMHRAGVSWTYLISFIPYDSGHKVQRDQITHPGSQSSKLQSRI